MAHSSNAEAIITAVLRESIGAAVDATMFSAVAGDATHPPGLLNGITPIAASAAGAGAMTQDISNLIGAVASVGGTNVAIIANPAEVGKIAVGAGANFQFKIYSSNAVPAKTVIAIALNAFVSASDPVPRIETTKGGSVHFNTAPASDGTLGGPVISPFQTDIQVTRLVLFASWGLRSPGGIAFTEDVNW